MLQGTKLRHYRSLFLSDIHLGYHGCNADLLLAFLRGSRTQNLYLVGDIVDLISLNNRPFWPQAHNDVIRAILGKAKHETRVVYIPGNHDAQFRDYCGLTFGNVEIRRRCIHTSLQGRRYLVTHGDEFDGHVACSAWRSAVGAFAYRRILYFNARINRARSRFGYPYWSLAAFIKEKSGSARRYIERYREAATAAAARRGLDGIICGHIHRPEVTQVDGIEYLNDGDWVDNCSLLVEHTDGQMELLHASDLDKTRTRISVHRAA